MNFTVDQALSWLNEHAARIEDLLAELSDDESPSESEGSLSDECQDQVVWSDEVPSSQTPLW